jgi:hypothetical protein
MARKSSTREETLGRAPIIIDENPICFWDRSDSRTQLDFLSSIDPTYFQYLAEIHESRLEGEDSLKAAVALRVAYSHALETLYAVIGSAVQATLCPAGWLLKYRNSDLKNLVRKISDRRPFHNTLRRQIVGWDEVAYALLPWDSDFWEGNELRAASARLWRALAHDVLDESFEDEYNSLKHGLRVRSGEWYFALGREDVPGIPAPPERMRVMSSSRFGSTFLRALPLQRYQWVFEEQRVNWNPVVIARRIPLIVGSIENVISLLKHVNGVPLDELSVTFFDAEAVSNALIDPNPSSFSRLSTRPHVSSESIPQVSRDEILSSFVQMWRPRDEQREAD